MELSLGKLFIITLFYSGRCPNHFQLSTEVTWCTARCCRSCLFNLMVFISECRSEDSVDQPGGFLTASEGDSVTLPCTYTSTSTGQDYLFWYQQKPHGIPAYILWRYSTSGSNDETFKERFEANLTSNSVPLTIQNLQVSDSAVYYCALRPTVTAAHSVLIQKHRLPSHMDSIYW